MYIVVNSGQFGKNVQRLRKDMKLSRRNLARTIGIPAITLYRIEKGLLRDIDYRLLRRLCGVFQVRLEDMIT